MKCLSCYNDLPEAEAEFHPACCKKIFGSALPPVMPYSLDQLNDLGRQMINNRTALTGIQPKLSLHLDNRKPDGRNRLTIIDLWGSYILKPPSEQYPGLPELEDLTMHLAEIIGIKVVPHSLIRLASGELSYITRRIDRPGRKKIHMEDMCQLTEKLTEYKYEGSMELVGRTIKKYSSNPGLDLINLFELAVFSFITGNADMHLKNFSLLRVDKNANVLSPAYDLLPTKILMPEDADESALTINGKKKNITLKDFFSFGRNAGLTDKQMENALKKFREKTSVTLDFIDKGFIPQGTSLQFKDLISGLSERLKILI